MNWTYALIAIGSLAFAALLFLLIPRRFDPILQLKEAMEPEPRDGRTARERADIAAIHNGICPDCGDNGSLVAGPSGGRSQNVLCSACLSEFNVHHNFGGIVAVDHAGKASEDRARVFGVTKGIV